jgi:hypothetical protein
MARKSKIRTWEDVAECAGITVRELRELARHEPRLAAMLKDFSVGEHPSGIPMTPEEYEKRFLKDQDTVNQQDQT